ncbi:TPA_asm: hypothetical protein G0D46_24130 [Salmonella enterica subsp. enterica serovar Java]|nr:hypothetical protein [Salmonella enterica subsp. enterica serovar Java]
MATEKEDEIYAIAVHLSSGETLEGYVRRGGDIEGEWLIISRTLDMNSATYISRDKITHFDLDGIK